MQMCPQCSHDNSDNARFCAACREPLRNLLGAHIMRPNGNDHKPLTTGPGGDWSSTWSR